MSNTPFQKVCTYYGFHRTVKCVKIFVCLSAVKLTRLRRVWVMVECRGSRVIGRGSRVESRGRGSKVEVEGRGSKVEGRGSRVEGRGSKVESRNVVTIINFRILILVKILSF